MAVLRPAVDVLLGNCCLQTWCPLGKTIVVPIALSINLSSVLRVAMGGVPDVSVLS